MSASALVAPGRSSSGRGWRYACSTRGRSQDWRVRRIRTGEEGFRVSDTVILFVTEPRLLRLGNKSAQRVSGALGAGRHRARPPLSHCAMPVIVVPLIGGG